jgi:cell division protein FtsZ
MLIKPQSANVARIKVIGVGGAGGNAINNMIQNYDIEGVEFIAVNTDAQALAANRAETKLQIGDELTRGLGSGGNPAVGKKAAEESVDLLHEHLAGSDMVFITAGMGGGTGTGASPVIAGIAKNLGALTVAIVEKPFNFEGKRRMESALKGISEIKDKVDTLIVIPNQRLLDVVEKNISFLDAMKKVDDVLAMAVKSISQLITQNGFINVDFADVKAIMESSGTALMGMGSASGEGRAKEATIQAMNSPLLELSIDGARGILFNIIGGKDLGMQEISEAANLIGEAVHKDSNVIFGANIDPELGDQIQITLLATGFDTDKSGTPISQFHNENSFSNSITRPQTNVNQSNSRYSDDIDLETEESDEYEDTPIITKSTSNKPKGYSLFGQKDDNSNEDWETPSFLRRKKEY